MQPGAEGGEGGSPIIAMLPFVLIFVLFYFLILRPQQKEKGKREQMLQELKRGDDVITSGGIHGKITNIQDDVISLEIAKNVTVRISRGGIGGLLNKDDDNAKEDKAKK